MDLFYFLTLETPFEILGTIDSIYDVESSFIDIIFTNVQYFIYYSNYFLFITYI